MTRVGHLELQACRASDLADLAEAGKLPWAKAERARANAAWGAYDQARMRDELRIESLNPPSRAHSEGYELGVDTGRP